MKKLLVLFVTVLTISLTAQTHQIIQSFTGGDIIRDSLRFTNLSTLTPKSDSLHIINLNLKFDFMNFILLPDTNSTRDSVKITSGIIDYTKGGVAYDTTWCDEVVLRDSSYSVVARATSSTVNAKSYLILNPAVQLLKVELVNYRAAVPTRCVHYRLVATTRKTF